VSCDVTRNANGKFVLTVVGTGVKDGATVTISGGTGKKVKQNGNTFTIVGQFCNLLPGPIVITNPKGTGDQANCSAASLPLQCNKTCATQ